MARYTHDTSPWLKRVLIPFWALRIALMVLLALSYIIVIGVVEKGQHDGTVNRVRGRAIAISAVFLALLLICLLLDIISIVKCARNNLRPRTFLIFNVIQTTFWAVMLALDLSRAAARRSGLTAIFGIIVFLLFLGLLIYASVVYHRERKNMRRGIYAPATNPASELRPQQSGQTGIYQEAYAPYAQPSSRDIQQDDSPQRPQLQTTEYFAPAAASSAAAPEHQLIPHSYYSPSVSPQPPNSPFASRGPFALPRQPESHPTMARQSHVLPPPIGGSHGEPVEMA